MQNSHSPADSCTDPANLVTEAQGVDPGTIVRSTDWVVFFTSHRSPEPQPGTGWKGLLGITQPNPLPKQAAQDLVQAGLEYLQRRRLHSPSGQLGPGLHHPHSKEIFAHVSQMLKSVVSSCPASSLESFDSPPPLFLPGGKQVLIFYFLAQIQVLPPKKVTRIPLP